MKVSARLVAVAVAIAGLAIHPAAAAGQDHFPPTAELERMLRYMVEDSVVPGAVLGVLEADGTRRIVSYGSAGEGALPLGPLSTFEIGSVTKTFTTTVLADMVEREEVALDDPVAKYLPDSVRVPSRGGREITLRDLAVHTSGLPQQGHRAEDIYDPYADFTLKTLYAFLDTVELRDIPGTRYRYSNVGMCLLAHALERAAGEPYPRLLRERVLGPLGMSATTYAPEDDVAEHLVVPHDRRGAIGYRTLPPATYGQGGLFSNAEDLLRYLRAQVDPADSELGRALRMTHGARLTTVDRSEALGWHLSIFGADTVLWHGGATGGTSTLVAFDPRQRIGAVLLANIGGLASDLPVALVAGNPPPPEWERVTVEPGRLRRYAGRYEAVGGKGSYYVRLEDDGHLTYQPTGKPRARLYATSESTFFLLRGPWTFTFRDDPASDGIAMEMRVDERSPGVDSERLARKVSDRVPSSVAVVGRSWYRPIRGPGLWGLAILTALILSVLWLGPIGTRRRTRR